MRLDLTGSIRLSGPEGETVALPGRRAGALLAILATSRNQERSRDFLREMLWPRSQGPQASASLRSLLTALRAALHAYGPVVQADRRRVWIEGVSINEAYDGRAEFFEDAPDLGEAFEDWLRIERARVRNGAVQARASDAQQPPRRVCVAFYPAQVRADAGVGVLADLTTARIMQHMCLYEMVDVVDLTSLDNERAPAPMRSDQPAPDVAIQVRLSTIGDILDLAVRAFDPASRRVFWSASITADQSTAFRFLPPQFEEFANQATDLIHSAIMRSVECGQIRPGAQPSSIFGAVHQVLSMSLRGQDVARDFLREQMDVSGSSSAAAWYALSVANTLGEGGDVDALREEAAAACRRALELDPGNALSLALVGHVQGFVFRRLDFGAECLEMARRTAPTLAIVWDLSAMNALYRGGAAAATAHSGEAVRLARFSPYKALFQSSQAISASLSGDHRMAIETSRRVLDQLPGFLAVQRHLSGSLAAEGRLAESRAVVEAVRSRDPRFGPDALDDPGYPLPSPASVALLRRGFSSIGLTH